MKTYLVAAGGVVSALAASACCIGPLVLVSLGVSGAWIGGLTALAPYQPIFLAGAILCLAAGFWLVYGRAHRACPATGGRTGRFFAALLGVKGALWLGAALVALAAAVDYGLPLFL
jgi:mercuric ion transport protein